ncbi:MAG: (d)CMP kinase [Fimbriimonadaceae bacterium]
MSKFEGVIAIDGPAGAGKSTVARAVALRLGLNYLDTGAMYRAVALKSLREGIKHDDAEKLGVLASNSTIEFGPGTPQQVFLDGENVTKEIRAPNIGDLASAVSVHPAVRRVVVQRQRELIGEGRITLDGRDTTTVVAPDAEVKIFLTASLEERAKRRHKELIQKGIDVPLSEVQADIDERDRRDMTRTDSPLRQAEDAILIDSTDMNAADVVDRVVQIACSAS